MIVEMRTGAAREEIDAVVAKAKSLDLGVQLEPGHGQGSGRPAGRQYRPDTDGYLRGAARRRERHPHHEALQAGFPRVPARQHGGRLRRGEDRRGAHRRHGRSLRRRERKPVDAGGGGGEEGRGQHPARRRLQAAHVAVQLPGTAEKGAGAAGRGQERVRYAGGDRGGQPAGGRAWWRPTPTCSR